MTKQTIQQIHLANTGKVSDKWAYYLPYYDKLFYSKQSDNINLLEIGIQNGGSLETWSKYFENAKTFVGCDIDPLCANLRYSDPRVNVVVGNANHGDTINRISNIASNFDIIIDDGSHHNDDIFWSFIQYFPLLNSGGIYVVEDTHTLYESYYGGGLTNVKNVYNLFKKLIDVINFKHWRDAISIDQYFQPFFEIGRLPQFIRDGHVESIEFHDSLIVIKKSTEHGHNHLGSRIITGSEAQVQPLVLEIRKQLGNNQ